LLNANMPQAALEYRAIAAVPVVNWKAWQPSISRAALMICCAFHSTVRTTCSAAQQRGQEAEDYEPTVT